MCPFLRMYAKPTTLFIYFYFIKVLFLWKYVLNFIFILRKFQVIFNYILLYIIIYLYLIIFYL